ncbi:hypothetical protein MMYC01_201380 [Madurella mycetomatis]|uniref:Myb-like domain-containing protein n=1 Tax=Madurella mycetomatis TaxID=100816 RepID=A0A175WCK3_9PEZI|nr:hypothetical protein MMYC01_201380 [Madurella mycetomatis]
MNKNWNDRADKDLFFTILSVKNIGVISGSEWITIGNHMRSLGYGFTNEGCRQHFQGLRRAQNKAEANGVPGDNPRKIDPTLNPITRRPGPGRGRPRKQPAQPAAATGPAGPTGTAPGASSAPPLVPGAPPAVAGAPGVPAGPPMSGMPPVSTAPADPAGPAGPAGVGTSGAPSIPSAPPTQVLPASQAQPRPPPHPPLPAHLVQSSNPGVAPQAQMAGPDDLAVDPSLEEDPEEHAAKRPRLNESQDSSIEDEAVLNALAVHSNPTPGEYTTEYTYGDA